MVAGLLIQHGGGKLCVPDFVIVLAKMILPGVSCKMRFSSNFKTRKTPILP
jgi:hypothetical protein